MAEFLSSTFYLLGGWMYLLWSVDNPPPKLWYLNITIPLWPLPAVLLLVVIAKRIVMEAYEKFRNS